MKKALVLLLALVMCLSLAACGENAESPATPGENPVSGSENNAQNNSEALSIPDVANASVLKDGSCGPTATFKLYDNGVLVISGTGEVVGKEFSMYAGYVEYVKVEEGITLLGNKVLCDLDKNKVLELPSTLKTIDVAAVRDNTSLVSVNFPEGLETIDRYAFTMCISLEQVELPSSLTTLGECAFGYCDISDLVIRNGLPSIGKNAFQSNALEFVVIPGSVTYIGEGAFSDCEDLTTVILCDGVQTLAPRCFENIKTIAMPDSVVRVEVSKIGQPNQVSSGAVVYCNEGSYAANRYSDRCDVIVGYDGFIKKYDLTKYN